MEKKYFWLKLPEDFFRQKQIKKLRRIAGGDTYTIIYLKMLLVAMKQDCRLYFDGVEDDFYEELALDLDEDPENVRFTVLFLEKQGLIELVNENEYLLTKCGEMVGTEGASAARVRAHRKNKASLCDTKALHCNGEALHCNNDVTSSNAGVTGSNKTVTERRDREREDIEIETEKEKELEEEKEKENKNNVHSGASAKQITNTEINDFFDSVWNLYPVKKGKGQVSDSKRRALYKIGFEEISRAIDRYLTELQKDAAWRKPQNGSTFFNSGYVDYLDDNFVPDKKPEAQANTYQQQQSSYLDSIRNRVSKVDEWYAEESDEPTMWDFIDEKEE